MNSRRLPLALSFSVLLLSAAAAQPVSRTWTSQNGQTLEGTYVSCTAVKVMVLRADGRTVQIDRDKLTEDDQLYVDRAYADQTNATTTARDQKAEADRQATKDKAEQDAADAKETARSKPTRSYMDRMLAGFDAKKTPDFTSAWPKDVGVDADPTITVIKEDAAAKEFVYESPHFHFQSNVLLKPSLLSKIAVMFEATYRMHHDIPLNNRRTRSPEAGKLLARMFETTEQYHAAGAPSFSAGVYMGGNRDEFMVPLDELGVKKVGSGYMFDYQGDFHTMFHELTHQLWGDIPECAGTWMVEGFAEYMACAPFSNGKFSLAKQPSWLMDYMVGTGKKNNGGRALGKDIYCPPLEDLMSWDQDVFYSKTTINRNYGLGLLLVDYFLTCDGEGDKAGENFKKCIEACQHGASEEEARSILLAGRSYKQLEGDVAAAMHKKGIKITFNDAG